MCDAIYYEQKHVVLQIYHNGTELSIIFEYTKKLGSKNSIVLLNKNNDKMKDFRIEFSKADATYQSGEIVSGRVYLRISSSKNVKGEKNVKIFHVNSWCFDLANEVKIFDQ